MGLFYLGWSEVTENHLSNFAPEGVDPAARVLVSGQEREAGILTFSGFMVTHHPCSQCITLSFNWAWGFPVQRPSVCLCTAS